MMFCNFFIYSSLSTISPYLRSFLLGLVREPILVLKNFSALMSVFCCQLFLNSVLMIIAYDNLGSRKSSD